MKTMLKILKHKHRGEASLYIYGFIFMLIILVYCLFEFRLTMVNAAFNFCDDGLTSSLLGSALINLEEFGKSNQIVVKANDVWKTDSADYITKTSLNFRSLLNSKGWTQAEADILLSELNFGSEVILDYSALPDKKVVDSTGRQQTTIKSGDTDRVTGNYSNDEYIKRAYTSFIDNLQVNLSNGNKNLTTSISSATSTYLNNNSIIPLDTLKNMLGQYIASDIEITRFDIYNIYRANLADKHVYQSEYMTYNGVYRGWASASSHKQDITSVTWTTEIPVYSGTLNLNNTFSMTGSHNENAFKTWYNTNYGVDVNSPTISSSQLNQYLVRRSKWVKDSYAYRMSLSGSSGNADRASGGIGGEGYHLICFTNSETTFQGKLDTSKTPYKYYYMDKSSGNRVPGTYTNGVSGSKLANYLFDNNALPIDSSQEPPIVAHSIYSYKKSGGVDTSNYESGLGVTYKYTEKNSHNSEYLTLQQGKMAGAEIRHTSIYAELSFTVATLPKAMIGGDIEYTDRDGNKTSIYVDDSFGQKRVTIARLVDIEVNDD